MIQETSGEVFKLRRGNSPLVVSMPHVGTHIPAHIEAGMTPVAARRDDTDWHLEALYDFLDELDATVIIATHSRYVADLNRPISGPALYAGQDNTGVCSSDTFDRAPLYLEGRAPDAAEIERRVETYWRPYHAAVAAELARVRGASGVALLWDAHSVRSVVPRFFEGRLPDFNFGTVHGTSCGPGLGETLMAIAEADKRYSAVLNGRFVGGYVTRAHGQPGQGIHAVQLELSQITYMNETHPYAFDERRAAEMRPLLKALLKGALAWAEDSR